MTETTAATGIQAKAAKIGRYYALHDQAERRAWSKDRRPGADRRRALEAIADQASTRAQSLEDSLASERPASRIDALILAGWARILTAHVDEIAPGEGYVCALERVLDSLVQFLEADAGTTLEALGLKAWAGRGDRGEPEHGAP